MRGGNRNYTAADVQAAYAGLNGAFYEYGMQSADGYDIVTAGGAAPGAIAFRQDVWGNIQRGRMGRIVGVDYRGQSVPVCGVIGHEGVHLAQFAAGRSLGDPLNEPEAYATNRRWRC
jgi:hypothetical protein